MPSPSSPEGAGARRFFGQPNLSAVPPGAAVTWTYRIQNTGNVDLIEVKVTDDKGVTVDCGGSDTVAVLKVGETKTCSATGTAVTGPTPTSEWRAAPRIRHCCPGQPPVTTGAVTDADSATYTGTPAVASQPPIAPTLPPGTLPETAARLTLAALAVALVLGGGTLLWIVARRRPAS